MVSKEEDIRWLRIKLSEAKTDIERKYIQKQLELLENSDVDYNKQLILQE